MPKTKSKSNTAGASRSNAPRRQPASSIKSITMPNAIGYQMMSAGLRPTVICHRELVTRVDLVNGDNWASRIVNPGRELFPWLGSFATSFDSYRFRRLKFEYVPSCSTTTQGNIFLSFDYHVEDPLPDTSQQLAMNWRTVVGPVYLKSEMSVDISRFHFRSYFTATPGTNIDVTRDVGRFILLSTGNATQLSVGNIWVSYEVELMEPQLPEMDPVGEFGDPRTTSLNDLAGPGASADFATVGTYRALLPIPGTPRAAQQVFDLKDLVVGADGYELKLPTDWIYAKIDLIVRAISDAFQPYTTDDIFTVLGITHKPNEAIVTDLANTCACSTINAGSKWNYANTYVARRASGTQKMPMSIIARAATGLASHLMNMAVSIIATRLTVEGYNDILAG